MAKRIVKAAPGLLTSTPALAADRVADVYGKQVDLVEQNVVSLAEANHSYNHYGQMVIYARMNGIVPPASRR